MTLPPVAVTVRTEGSGEQPLVRAVTEAAFGRALEADIVDGVRGTADWLADGSIVALDENRRVIGHVLLSRGRLVGSDGSATDIGMIGPVSVMPELQRRGIGGQLMRAAISAAVVLRLPIICLLGHPTYYPRFGFELARPLGIEAQDPAWPDEAWMVFRLPAWTPALRGMARFAPAFG